MKNDGVDFVLPWVDERDPKWQKSFQNYSRESGDKRLLRFRDMGTLRYWFRGVEKFAPWVHKVFFITCGQCPDWLNTDHPKLVCVRHDEYIPRDYLPTFSSHTIEWNLNRIPELSEQFVLFNDDTFLTGPTRQEDFFLRGLPCGRAILERWVTTEYPLFLVPTVNAFLLNRHFKKKRLMLRYFGKFFSPKYGAANILNNLKYFIESGIPGFQNPHLPNALLKSAFQEVWAAEPELLDQVCRHRFRENTDVNQWAVQGWQYCTGRFFPQKETGKAFFIHSLADAEAAAEEVTAAEYNMICLNDGAEADFEQIKLVLCRAFESVLPQKSSFER